VKEHWATSVADADKMQIKGIILPFLLSGPPPKLRAQLAQSLTLIAQHDFPQFWPNLVSELVARANTQDPNVLIAVLRTSHSVFRRFRNVSMSTDVLRELKFILEQFQAPLLAIYVQTWTAITTVGADGARMLLLLEVANLCTKLFYDLTFVDLPEFFEDHMKEWMTGFLHSIQFTSKLPALNGPDHDTPGTAQKLQKNVCMALTLFSTKYDEEFSQYLQGFVHGVWQLLTEALSTNHAKYEAIVAHGVAFLTAVANGAHHALFADGAILKSICEKIVIPCMMMRDEDAELFEDDPLEYVRQDIEGSDLDTRRRSAKELVKGLRKNYEKPATEIFGQYIQILLQQSVANPKTNWKAKDVAVFLLTAVAVSTYRVATGANSVNEMVPLMPFFQSSIMPDLQVSGVHPILQADALKFVITFRSQIPPTEYGKLIPAIVGMLKSRVWVVHTYAAHAIDHMLTIKDVPAGGGPPVYRITKESLEPMLRELLGSLFGVFHTNGGKPNSYVMRAIMRVLSKAKEKIAPYVTLVLEQLSILLRSVIANPQSPVANHYLFESIGALIGCAAAAGGSQAVSSLQGSLLPMFQSILGADLVEFTGYAFQLLGQLLREHQEVPDVYWNLFQSLMDPALWNRPGNVPALVKLLSQYMLKGGAKIAANEQWMGMFLGVWQHLNSSAKYDGETFELLTAYVEAMPLTSLDKYVPRLLQLIFVRLSTPKGKTPRYVSGFVTWLLAFAARHGMLGKDVCIIPYF
jgi:exportin-2 (importin alpha re-exporter)